VRTLAELIDFNKRNAGDELSYFGQELFEQATRRRAERSGLPRCPQHDPPAGRRAGHRCGLAGAATGCADRTGDRRRVVADMTNGDPNTVRAPTPPRWRAIPA
jgi:hypothetical protein